MPRAFIVAIVALLLSAGRSHALGDPPPDSLVPLPMLVGVPTWEELAPPARAYAATVLDTRRNRMLVIGGAPSLAGPGTSTVWALELSRTPYWTRVRPTGPEPEPRWGACAVYDSLRDRVVLFGGASRAVDPEYWPPDSARSDLWLLTLSGTPTWSVPPRPWHEPTDTLPKWPSARVRATLTLDPARGSAWLFGGERTAWPESWSSDLWRLDLASLTWELRPVAEPWPPGRAGHGAVWVPGIDRLVLHGGRNRDSSYGRTRWLRDTWALDPATSTWAEWSQDTVGIPVTPSSEHTLVWRPVEQELVRLTGEPEWDGGVWRMNVTTHEWWQDPGVWAPPLAGAAAVWEGARDRIVVSGGLEFAGPSRSDTWALGLAGPVESRFAMLLPAPRVGAPSLVDFDPRWSRLMVLQEPNTLWFHDRASGVWTPWQTRGSSPGSVAYASAALDTARRRWLVVGGVPPLWGPEPDREVHALSIDGTPEWTSISEPAGPAMFEPAVVWNAGHSRLYVVGSDYPRYDSLQAWRIDVADRAHWQRLIVEGGPHSARLESRIVRDDRHARALLLTHSTAPGAEEDSLWSVALGDTVRLEPIVLGGRAPARRSRPALTFDPLRDRVMLHGGSSGSSPAEADGPRAWEASLTSAPQWRSVVLQGDRPDDGPAVFVEIPGDPQSRLEWLEGRVFLVSWELPLPPSAVVDSASLTAHGVRLVWAGASTDGWAVSVERQDALGAWRALGSATSDATGRWRFTDVAPPAGSLAYRLVFERATGPFATGEVRIGSPAAGIALNIASVRPNPARVPERVELSLPRAANVTLELLDVTGRRVWSRALPVLPAGTHVLPLGLADAPRPGLYWLRASAAGERATTRLAIVR